MSPACREETLVERILALVAARRGIDFRDYARRTLQNRVRSRMAAAGVTSMDAYFDRLTQERGEIDRLVETLVIPVTSFFRDAAPFHALSAQVVPALADASPLRVWHIGAATGEEVWSVAMLLSETGRPFEVVASDLDERSLAVARAALYPEALAAEIPYALRGRYLQREATGLRVAAGLRALVRFAQHDLMGTRLAPREAIVASFRLVLCRNVLLYFEGALRSKAIARLGAVIEPGGALVLGTSEALPSGGSDAFLPWPGVEASCRIFQRRLP